MNNQFHIFDRIFVNNNTTFPQFRRRNFSLMSERWGRELINDGNPDISGWMANLNISYQSCSSDSSPIPKRSRQLTFYGSTRGNELTKDEKISIDKNLIKIIMNDY